MRIRQMTAEDIPAVAQIEKECFSQPWSEQGFLDGMKDAIFFVAEDPQIAGYIGTSACAGLLALVVIA